MDARKLLFTVHFVHSLDGFPVSTSSLPVISSALPLGNLLKVWPGRIAIPIYNEIAYQRLSHRFGRFRVLGDVLRGD